MEWIEREIISLMHEYHVNADETIEELAEDIIDIVKEKYSVCHECGSKLPN